MAPKKPKIAANQKSIKAFIVHGEHSYADNAATTTTSKKPSSSQTVTTTTSVAAAANTPDFPVSFETFLQFTNCNAVAEQQSKKFIKGEIDKELENIYNTFYRDRSKISDLCYVKDDCSKEIKKQIKKLPEVASDGFPVDFTTFVQYTNCKDLARIKIQKRFPNVVHSIADRLYKEFYMDRLKRVLIMKYLFIKACPRIMKRRIMLYPGETLEEPVIAAATSTPPPPPQRSTSLSPADSVATTTSAETAIYVGSDEDVQVRLTERAANHMKQKRPPSAVDPQQHVAKRRKEELHKNKVLTEHNTIDGVAAAAVGKQKQSIESSNKSPTTDDDEQCLPASFEEFRDCTNVRFLAIAALGLIVKDGEPSAKDEAMIIQQMQRLYHLYYTKPERRSCRPLCYIKIDGNCTWMMREKLLKVPDKYHHRLKGSVHNDTTVASTGETSEANDNVDEMADVAVAAAASTESPSSQSVAAYQLQDQVTAEQQTTTVSNTSPGTTVEDPTLPVSFEEFRNWTNVRFAAIDEMRQTLPDYDASVNDETMITLYMRNFYQWFYKEPEKRACRPLCYIKIDGNCNSTMREKINKVPDKYKHRLVASTPTTAPEVSVVAHVVEDTDSSDVGLPPLIAIGMHCHKFLNDNYLFKYIMQKYQQQQLEESEIAEKLQQVKNYYSYLENEGKRSKRRRIEVQNVEVLPLLQLPLQQQQQQPQEQEHRETQEQILSTQQQQPTEEQPVVVANAALAQAQISPLKDEIQQQILQQLQEIRQKQLTMEQEQLKMQQQFNQVEAKLARQNEQQQQRQQQQRSFVQEQESLVQEQEESLLQPNQQEQARLVIKTQQQQQQESLLKYNRQKQQQKGCCLLPEKQPQQQKSLVQDKQQQKQQPKQKGSLVPKNQQRKQQQSLLLDNQQKQQQQQEEKEREEERERRESLLLENQQQQLESSVQHNQQASQAQQQPQQKITRSSTESVENIENAFFQIVDKCCVLPYVMRMSEGVKSAIIKKILKIPLDEFLQYTKIYKAPELLYRNKKKMKRFYRYAIEKKKIWPHNLYIPLGDLICYVMTHIPIGNCDFNLEFISPKLLHWHDIMHATDYDYCVQFYYFKRYNEVIESDALTDQMRECYYKKCYEQELWKYRVPKITNEKLIDLANMLKGVNLQKTTVLENENAEIYRLLVQSESEAESESESESSDDDDDDGETDVNAAKQMPEACHSDSSTETLLNVACLNPPRVLEHGALTNDFEEEEESLYSLIERVSMLASVEATTTSPTPPALTTETVVLATTADSNAVTTIVEAGTTSTVAAAATPTKAESEKMASTAASIASTGPTQTQTPRLSQDLFASSGETDNILSMAAQLPMVIKAENDMGSYPLNKLQFIINEDSTTFTCIPMTEEVCVLDETLDAAALHLSISPNISQKPTPLPSPADKLEMFDAVLSQMESGHSNSSQSFCHNSQSMPSSLGDETKPVVPLLVEPVQHEEMEIGAFITIPKSAVSEVRKNREAILNAATTETVMPAQLQSAPTEVVSAAATAKQTIPSQAAAMPTSLKNNKQVKKATSAVATKIPKIAMTTATKTTTKTAPAVAAIAAASTKQISKTAGTVLVPQITHNFPALPLNRMKNSNQKTHKDIVSVDPTYRIDTTAAASVVTTEIEMVLPPIQTAFTASQLLAVDNTLFNNTTLGYALNRTQHEMYMQQQQQQQQKLSQQLSQQQQQQQLLQQTLLTPEQQLQQLFQQQPSLQPIQQLQLLTPQQLQLLNQQLQQQRRAPANLANATDLPTTTDENTNTNTDHTTVNQECHSTNMPQVNLNIVPAQNLYFCKTLLYRHFQIFHYFDKLTLQHFNEHKLQVNCFYERYMQATIVSEGTRKLDVRINELQTLLPHCSSVILDDLLRVLHELKEYHYSCFEKPSPTNDNLCERILYHVFHTNPIFCNCILILEYGIHYLGRLDPIDPKLSCMNSTIARRPHRALREAIKPAILEEIVKLKKNL